MELEEIALNNGGYQIWETKKFWEQVYNEYLLGNDGYICWNSITFYKAHKIYEEELYKLAEEWVSNRVVGIEISKDRKYGFFTETLTQQQKATTYFHIYNHDYRMRWIKWCIDKYKNN